jgi:hypothetical protein
MSERRTKTKQEDGIDGTTFLKKHGEIATGKAAVGVTK